MDNGGRRRYDADALIVTAGAWARGMLRELQPAGDGRAEGAMVAEGG